MTIAKVEPLLTTRSVSGPFDYRLPESMEGVDVGSVLVVPFGRRRVKGVVVGIAERSELPAERLAEPVEALEAGVPPELVELGRWVGEEYCSTPARGLGLVLPGNRQRRRRPAGAARWSSSRSRRPPRARRRLAVDERLGIRQRAVLRALGCGAAAGAGAGAIAGSDRATLRRLEGRGLVRTAEVERRRRPASPAVGRDQRGASG